jgi:hypothetical protein
LELLFFRTLAADCNYSDQIFRALYQSFGDLSREGDCLDVIKEGICIGRAIVFFGLTMSAFGGATLDVLVNAAASFSATIQQQLEMLQSDQSPADTGNRQRGLSVFTEVLNAIWHSIPTTRR